MLPRAARARRVSSPWSCLLVPRGTCATDMKTALGYRPAATRTPMTGTDMGVSTIEAQHSLGLMHAFIGCSLATGADKKAIDQAGKASTRRACVSPRLRPTSSLERHFAGRQIVDPGFDPDLGGFQRL